MRKEGLALQYSIYLVHGNIVKIELLLDQLGMLINKRVDDIRVYPLGSNVRIWSLGNQFDEGGNTLSDDILNRLQVTSIEKVKS